jgi:hypothetical protein
MKYFNLMMALSWCVQLGLIVWGWSLGRISTDALSFLILMMVTGLLVVGVSYYVFIVLDESPDSDETTTTRHEQ